MPTNKGFTPFKERQMPLKKGYDRKTPPTTYVQAVKAAHQAGYRAVKEVAKRLTAKKGKK
jgi:hypothetical protein